MESAGLMKNYQKVCVVILNDYTWFKTNYERYKWDIHRNDLFKNYHQFNKSQK